MYLLIFVFLQYFYKGTIYVRKNFRCFFQGKKKAKSTFLKEKRNNVRKGGRQ